MRARKEAEEKQRLEVGCYELRVRDYQFEKHFLRAFVLPRSYKALALERAERERKVAEDKARKLQEEIEIQSIAARSKESKEMTKRMESISKS